MKGKKGNTIIVLTVALIIGIISLSIGWQTIQDKTLTTAITDDQFSASNSTCVEITDNCVLSITSIENATIPIGSGNYSLCNVDAPSQSDDGVLFTVGVGDEYNGETLNVTYTEVDCSRITGTTATIINYTPVLWALGLLVLVAGFIGVAMWKD